MIEQPGRVLFFFQQKDDPLKHVLLNAPRGLSPDGWIDLLRRDAARAGGRELLVYVHGFNNSFEDAAKRTAQLAFDLNMDGLMAVMYSWPSRTGVVSYPSDEDASQAAIPSFEKFLTRLADSSGVSRVYIVAHSMGTRMLSVALSDLVKKGKRNLFAEVVLAAPDIDADVFQQQLLPAMQQSARRFTLYASRRDLAIAASHELHHDIRAGEDAAQWDRVAGIDVVDASNMESSFLGHAYVAENKQVLDDLFMLVRHGLAPSERNLRRQPTSGSAFHWVLP
ncbi:MAG: alpha/beta fold hydrolase [Gemmatimonadetes bacterium]|nr:alpha/beta fold hydrolase [Gemmatimonadota bacterium]